MLVYMHSCKEIHSSPRVRYYQLPFMHEKTKVQKGKYAEGHPDSQELNSF